LKTDLLKLYRDSGAIKEGHFELSSGMHSNRYMQSALVLQYPWHAEILGKLLADKIRDYKIKTVVSPAIGALFIGYETARALSSRMIFVERKSGELSLRRGFEISEGERCAVIEDVVTTGGSLLRTIEIVKSFGGDIAVVGALVDRESGLDKKIDIPYLPLLKIAVKSYDKESCPLCREKIKLEKPGSQKIKNGRG